MILDKHLVQRLAIFAQLGDDFREGDCGCSQLADSPEVSFSISPPRKAWRGCLKGFKGSETDAVSELAVMPVVGLPDALRSAPRGDI